jgi:Domain of unknown function (DUF4259)
MGTWGEGAFDNDTAADWALAFDGADQAFGMRLIEDVLKHAAGTPASDYLDCDDGARAIAAAELVAYIAGQPADATPYNEEALRWAARTHPRVPPPVVNLARLAVARVISEGSELAELWDDVPSSWRSSVAQLAAKLKDGKRG